MTITVYSKNQCMQCKMTKRYLKEHGVTFEEHNLSLEPEYIDKVKALGYMRTPVVQIDEATTFAGFQPNKLANIANMIKEA